MLLTREVEIIPNGRMISYYKNKGYDAKYHQPLLVKIEDLSNGSKAMVEVQCDYCGAIKTIPYIDYLKSIKLKNKYSCIKCAYNKAFETNLYLYGNKSYSSTKQCRQKVVQTNIERYGVENPFQSKSVREKIEKNNLEKYGVRCLLSLPSFHQHSREVNMEKYGVYHHLQNPEILAKQKETFYKNNTCPTSKQQNYLCFLYDGELNYPFKMYNFDIYLPNEKLDIEFDGSGHFLSVERGNLTKEEFNKKEIIRNTAIKREGYKQMRIVSSKDLLPSDDILLEMLCYTRSYFSKYPQHSWIEFNIDLSSVRSAEYADGISYNYGGLHTIK